VAAQTRLTVTQAATLTGFVSDTEFTPLPEAAVTVGSTGRSAVVASDGSYTVTGFRAGVHPVRATYGDVCGLETVAENVETAGETMLDLMLAPVTDRLGYTRAAQSTSFQAADQTVVTLSGDNAVAEVGLPFAFPFYGQTYRSAWLDMNGLVSFTDPGDSHPYRAVRNYRRPPHRTPWWHPSGTTWWWTRRRACGPRPAVPGRTRGS
jgi:hypothetical protein